MKVVLAMGRQEAQAVLEVVQRWQGEVQKGETVTPVDTEATSLPLYWYLMAKLVDETAK